SSRPGRPCAARRRSRPRGPPAAPRRDRSTWGSSDDGGVAASRPAHYLEQAQASSTRGALVDVAVVGCGVFGLATALELRARGHRVVAFDQGVVPYPKASSYDASKTIQRLYGGRA